MRILLVEQGSGLSALRETFFSRDLEINQCEPYQSIPLIERDQPDVVVIDTETFIALPAFFSRLKELYITPTTGGYYPVMIGVIPRQSRIHSESLYLDLGFDLVFQKPIESQIFFSRLAALNRRIGIGKATLMSSHLLINTETQSCYTKSAHGTLFKAFRVSPVQFSILRLFIQSPRKIWSRDEIVMSLIREPDEVGDRAIDKTVCHLRRKLKSNLKTEWRLEPGYKYPFIQTQDGVGYYFFDAVSLPSDDINHLTDSNILDNYHRQAKLTMTSV